MGGWQKRLLRDAAWPYRFRMGAKYLPTVRDQKASQRFQQKQNPLKKFKKNGGKKAGK